MRRKLSYTKRLSKELNNLNLSYLIGNTTFKTYWCRIAMNEHKDFNDKLHAHSFYEIHFCLKGWAKFVVGGEEHILKEGKFAFIPKKCSHQIAEISEDFEKLVWGVNATYELPEQPLADEFVYVRHHRYLKSFCILPYTEQSLALLWLILQNIKEKPSDWYQYVKQYLYCLWTEFAHAVYNANQGDVAEGGGYVDLKAEVEMATIKRYVLDNLHNRVTVKDVARQLAVSERQLFRLFVQKYGITAREYIYQVQMEEAKRFLGETSDSVTEIAEKIGYSDRFAFDRAFERYEGMSPAQFRLSLQK